MTPPSSPKYSILEAKQKVEAYCAYQERCDYEIRKKLRSWNMHHEDIDVLIADLISNNFLNEERFAEAYVSGKFRIKRWGKLKIMRELKFRQISDYSIKKAMAQIDDEAYWQTAKDLMAYKERMSTFKNDWDRKIKIKRFLASKGYENWLINDLLA